MALIACAPAMATEEPAAPGDRAGRAISKSVNTPPMILAEIEVVR
jgi:hypothetical protein